jgi:probable F420-dependent oxidoreductase
VVDLGKIGIWSRELRYHEDRGATAEAAAELEELGYTALFIPDVGGDVLGAVEHLLAATRSVPVATGILNVWKHDPAVVAAGWWQIDDRYPGRFALGLGSSHAPIVDEGHPGRYHHPLSKMLSYLDALDAAGHPVPIEGRFLAALGPRMLQAAHERTAGAHPYLVPPEHTRQAREILGQGKMLAPEQAVLLETDRDRGRERARRFVADYLRLPNYVNNLIRLGYSTKDLSGAGSDRLVDDLVVYGDERAIAERVAAHHEAGADHVCIHVLGATNREELPMEQWRRLAPALTKSQVRGVKGQASE